VLHCTEFRVVSAGESEKPGVRGRFPSQQPLAPGEKEARQQVRRGKKGKGIETFYAALRLPEAIPHTTPNLTRHVRDRETGSRSRVPDPVSALRAGSR
jgi:hypothetical protein